MTAPDLPQLYLVSPPEFELSQFPHNLARVLDTVDIACVRLDLASRDEDRISRAADALRDITHARDVALVITDHLVLAERLGLDGVHLSDGARSVRSARKALGPDAIVGSFCAASRHDGMTAGEAGADYVSFGPVGSSALGDGTTAPTELFEWWSEMIEVPVVAEGGLTDTQVRALTPFTDFFGIGTEIWEDDDPVAALKSLSGHMAGVSSRP
ncbi:thiamine phosphate synthase [Thalassococcus sp. S3]|uniref:thiamine phosphate synthase n=1 Tax=Thalassococcus sp. S3 TaxID=2017482 RepID=UPI0010240BF7|nr:thiamine phosphate synthase [Thalassococcus sp. S3]QBF31772.1 thiamine phosphate synthase [Thalassococcus sp. S3]